MNKKSIITALLALVAMVGQGQVHYRLEGNIGDMPEGKRINFASILYPVFLGGGTTVFDGRTLRHPFLKGTKNCCS